MINQLAKALLAFTERQSGEGPYLTDIEGVAILRSDQPKPPLHMVSRPSMCIVAQGAKTASFGSTPLQYRRGQALIVGVETPAVGRIFEASPAEPCLVLAMELDLAILRDVVQHLDRPPKVCGAAGSGVFVADIDGPVAACALRLVHLLDTPDAIAIIYPLIMQEICYWLLAGPNGGEVMRLAQANPSPQVMAAMHRLQRDFKKPIKVEALAETAQMSTSVFHRQFKALTSLSPLQYLKQLRLLEARRLLLSKAINVEAAAYAVGYESPSQFSREYARLFGLPPRKDMQQMLAITHLRSLQA